MLREIYCDASATTPPLKEVIEQVSLVQRDFWANPSSIHNQGLLAAEILERSRLSIANNLGAYPEQVLFTSGATESINLALLRATENLDKGRLIISSVEHSSVEIVSTKLKKNGWEVSHWPVDHFGRVKLSLLDDILSAPTKLVSMIWGQSEIGTIQPIHQIGRECRKRGIIFHVDASQVLSQGYFNWNSLPIDLLSASGHKIRGPKGIGLLLIRNPEIIFPQYFKGSQKANFRPGTESVSLISGLSLAISNLCKTTSIITPECIPGNHNVNNLTLGLRRQLENISNLSFTGDPINRLPHHISFVLVDCNSKPINGRGFVRLLSKLGVYASNGSACDSSSNDPSRILEAIKVDRSLWKSGVRLSLGDWLTYEDTQQLPKLICTAIGNASKIENSKYY